MVAQKGRDLLLKIENGAGFCDCRGAALEVLSFNAQIVDVTDLNRRAAGGIAAAPACSARLSPAAASSRTRHRTRWCARCSCRHDCRLADRHSGFRHGFRPFQVAALDYSGAHDGEVLFEIALESAGALTFAVL